MEVDGDGPAAQVLGHIAGRPGTRHDRLRGDGRTFADDPDFGGAVLGAPDLAPLAGAVHAALAFFDALVPTVGRHRAMVFDRLVRNGLVAITAGTGGNELYVIAFRGKVAFFPSHVVGQGEHRLTDLYWCLFEEHRGHSFGSRCADSARCFRFRSVVLRDRRGKIHPAFPQVDRRNVAYG